MHTDVAALNGGLGGTEPKTNVLVPSSSLADLLALRLGLGVEEDVRLLLERTLRLDGQLGRHFCDNSVRRGNKVELGGRVVAEGVVGLIRLSTSILRKTNLAMVDIQCESCAVAALALLRKPLRIG